MTNIFEQATKMHLRFQHRGMLSVEDLWELDLAELDMIYRGLREQQKTEQQDSLLDNSNVNAKLALRVEIVKHIFGVKRAANEARTLAAANAVRKQQLLAVLARKEAAELEEMTEAEIRAAIEAL